MSRIAYRLWTNKDESEYVDNGLTLEQAEEVINYLWDVDEDYFNKADYIKKAKYYQAKVKKELGIDISWEHLFGRPVDIGWRYCSKCDTSFWADDGCECED